MLMIGRRRKNPPCPEYCMRAGLRRAPQKCSPQNNSIQPSGSGSECRKSRLQAVMRTPCVLPGCRMKCLFVLRVFSTHSVCVTSPSPAGFSGTSAAVCSDIEVLSYSSGRRTAPGFPRAGKSHTRFHFPFQFAVYL